MPHIYNAHEHTNKLMQTPVDMDKTERTTGHKVCSYQPSISQEDILGERRLVFPPPPLTHTHSLTLPLSLSTDSSLSLSQKCSLCLLSSHLLPMCVGLGERATALWQAEQLITSHIATASSTGMDHYIEELVSVRAVHSK